jgi:uncharacterized protein YuzE
MRIRYDRSVDAAYIDFTNDASPSEFGFSYECDPSVVGGQIHLNFDNTGRLMGLEILQASKKLPLSALTGASDA